MQTLTDFNLISVNELLVVRTSLLKSVFEINDGDNTYARLSDPDNFIGTLQNKWAFEKETSWPGKFSKILIKDNTLKSVGFFTFDINTKNLILEMNNGFKAELLKTSNFLKSDYLWQNVSSGDLITFKESLWSGKKPIKIIFNTPLNRHSIEMELMLLYGIGYTLIARFPQVKLPLGLI